MQHIILSDLLKQALCLDDTRAVFSEAIEVLGLDHVDEQILIAFGRFETKQKEFERARVIYKYALDNLPKSKTEKLYKAYSQFEKQHGDTEGIEDVILNKRRWKYEEVRTKTSVRGGKG
jgi:crooked neck